MKNVIDFIKKNLFFVFLTTFMIISMFIYCVYLIPDIIDGELVKKIIIMIFLLFAIILSIKEDNRSLIVFGVLFTALSDSLIVGAEDEAFTASGMFTFLIAQTIYMFELNRLDNKRGKILTIIRLSTILLAFIIVLIIMNNNINAVFLITTLYFLMLIFNFIQSIFNIKNNLLLTIGFLLFIICDIFVGIGVLESSFENKESNFLIYFLMNNSYLDWVFYIISQYLIILSIKYKIGFKRIKLKIN